MDIPVWKLRHTAAQHVVAHSSVPDNKTVDTASAPAVILSAKEPVESGQSTAAANTSAAEKTAAVGTDNVQLDTHATAGTAPVGNDPDQWLQWLISRSVKSGNTPTDTPTDTSGTTSAALMVLELPLERTERQSATVPALSGAAQRLYQAMLQAIDLSARQCSFGQIENSDIDQQSSIHQMCLSRCPSVLLIFSFPGLFAHLDTLLEKTEAVLLPVETGSGETAKVVFSYHPDYLLQHGEHKRRVWEDLKLVKTLLAAKA